MRRVHGPAWRTRARAGRGAFARHVVTVLLLGVAVGAVVARSWAVAGIATAAWTAATLQFAWNRIAPGPRTRREVAAMLATSALIPPYAVGAPIAGEVRARRLAAARRPASAPATDSMPS